MIQGQANVARDENLSDADRELLRDSVRDFLGNRWPAAEAVTKSTDPQAITALWREMSMQGLTALGADQREGGLREIALVFEELGQASCPAPLLGAVAANLGLAPHRSSFAPAGALLDELREGKATVAAAFGAFDGDSGAGRAEVGGEARSRVLNGRIAFVEGAACATHFFIFTDRPTGAAMVGASAPGLTVTATPGLAVPAYSELLFRDTPATLLAMEAEALGDIVFVSRLACAARAVGAAQRAFELAVEHAKVRRQFGQLIGQFQAIQHKLANCLISLEGARLTIHNAAEARDAGFGDWRALCSAALAFASPALREVSVQTHCALGAIGYSEEHEAPRHFRRVHADLTRFGGVARARAELAGHVLGPAA